MGFSILLRNYSTVPSDLHSDPGQVPLTSSYIREKTRPLNFQNSAQKSEYDATDQ